MNATEVKQLMHQEFKEIVEGAGFVGAESDLFIRKCPSGFESVSFSLLNYAPQFGCEFAVGKRFDIIERLIADLTNKFSYLGSSDDDSDTFVFTMGTLAGLNHQNYLPFMETPADCAAVGKTIKSFWENTGLPLLLKYEDLRALNKFISIDEDWRDNSQKPLLFGTTFIVKKIIIAYLSGWAGYTKLLDEYIEIYNTRMKDNQLLRDRLVDGKNHFEYLQELLEKVQP